ncbi:hypothetical protein AN480_28650 (plasmid) [Mycobacterium intracellulare subsp. chimaera]|uniref:hypothetical protein n=1 Tax=Mycobacterium intracellulare TaxID=1767 RepID=UPI000859648D|nr:hypothetical protein [Mycobacterium intracellulare]AOS95003.1 hypothetical protein AN480_28650 [Mycobacterium intracellulare subsp. chimaera]
MIVTDDPHTEHHPTRRADSSADDALDVQTVVVEERGRWAVDVIVVFADGIVRTRIDTHSTKARAELSARMIQRAAERDLEGPLNG